MAAIEHQHRGAGALILALVDVQVAVFHVERHFGALAPDGGKERLADIQVQRVAELVGLGRAGGLHAGGQVARIVAAEARFSERSEQVLERLEAQKIERLIGDFEARLAVAAIARAGRLLAAGLLDGDMAFVDELLHQAVE